MSWPLGRRSPAVSGSRALKTLTIVKDMALTPDQFFRDIDRAMRGLDYRIDGDRVIGGKPGHRVVINVRPLPARRLGGLLSLPRSEISISFDGYSEREQITFLEGFDRAFQRGGG